jgi:hypothetical protein
MYCTIERVSIDDNPTFEALSYTWGTSPERYQIQVGASVLSIGKNLAVALRTLSSGDKLRTIWIDAICIDQSNAAERNHQVRFMKDIYTRASSVGSDALLEHLDTLDASSALVEHRAWIDYEEEWSWDKGVSFQQPPVAQETVDALLCRPWFGRVWIQQEAAVNAHTKVQCGSKIVTWDQLFSLVWDYQKPSGEGFAKDQFSIDALRSSVLISRVIVIPIYQLFFSTSCGTALMLAQQIRETGFSAYKTWREILISTSFFSNQTTTMTLWSYILSWRSAI